MNYWPCTPMPYQPLPISTGNVGIDRCGNIDVYAAPKTVHRQVCWPQGGWPVPAQLPWWPWCGGRPGYGGGWWRLASGGIDPGFTAPPWWGPWDMAGVLRAGQPMAEWMIAARQQRRAA